MIRRPPRSTRTDTLFPYTTLFRSAEPVQVMAHNAVVHDLPLSSAARIGPLRDPCAGLGVGFQRERSEEHTSELQSLMRISYAVFCLKKKNKNQKYIIQTCYTT